MYKRILLLVLLSQAVSSWSLEVKVNDSRANNFYMDALRWVLDKSGQEYELIHTDHIMSSQVRKVALVQKGEIDVMYAGTTNEMEASLLPIRFPITRGLIGRRVFIINKAFEQDYAKVTSLEDLRQYSGVLSFGWPEKEILNAVGLKQAEILYHDIFGNLNQGSRYYFSRGILEAYTELLDKQDTMPNLMVEQSILLKYKSAVLFFINPENKLLEKALNTGFEKGYADGSYIEFLYNHPLIKESLYQVELEKRNVIEIPNPFFPSRSLAIPSQYWH
jgi:hypothetical protein